MEGQAKKSKQSLGKTPMDLRFIKRTVPMKDVNNEKLRDIELGIWELHIVAIWIFVGFQQPCRQNSQHLYNVTFYRTPVTSAQCIYKTDKHPDAGMLLNYDDNDYSQDDAQIGGAFLAQTKDDILQPYISDHEFRSSNNDFDLEHKKYVFDIRHQKMSLYFNN